MVAEPGAATAAMAAEIQATRDELEAVKSQLERHGLVILRSDGVDNHLIPTQKTLQEILLERDEEFKKSKDRMEELFNTAATYVELIKNDLGNTKQFIAGIKSEIHITVEAIKKVYAKIHLRW